MWSDLINTFLMEWSMWVHSCLMTKKGGNFSEPIDAMILLYINLFKFHAKKKHIIFYFCIL